MNASSRSRFAAAGILAIIISALAQVEAAEIPGKVRSSTNKYATIVSDSDLIPAPGDKAKIYFKLPGIDVEVSVATGHVYEITGPSIIVQIDQATGSVAKDQLVTIDSPHPIKRESGAAPAPSTAPSSQVVAPSETAPSPRQVLPPSIPSPTAAPETAAGENAASIDSAAQYLRQGMAQFNAGNIDGAIASYTSGIRLAPGLAALYLNRARAYVHKTELNAAIADANKALELKTDKADEAYVIRGGALTRLGNYLAAIADCNRALSINHNNALAYNNRANNELHLPDLDGALADCNISIALDPSSPLPYYNRGFVYASKGEASKAIADWEKAMQMQPAFRAELEPRVRKLGGSP